MSTDDADSATQIGSPFGPVIMTAQPAPVGCSDEQAATAPKTSAERLT
jgi:hypothetical protein